jgi:hypothetical protein
MLAPLLMRILYKFINNCMYCTIENKVKRSIEDQDNLIFLRLDNSAVYKYSIVFG